MKTLNIILIALPLFLISCTQNGTIEKTNNKIDSLLTQLDSAQTILNIIKSDSEAVKIKSMLKVNSKKLSVKSDSLRHNPKLFTKAGAYMNLYKFFKKLENKTGEIQINLTYTQNQLKDLKHDIPLLAKKDTAKLNKYLSDETKATNIVITKTNELYGILNKNKKTFYDLQQTIDSLLNN